MSSLNYEKHVYFLRIFSKYKNIHVSVIKIEIAVIYNRV